MSQTGVEPVSSQGGRCPANAPVKQYDVSMINVEITLNRWLDFYPGYMYVLTENIDKVRAERNQEPGRARQGRLRSGRGAQRVCRGQWIQPLVIRANQGDCVKIDAAQPDGRGEDGSLYIHGSSMIISATGKPATTTNPRVDRCRKGKTSRFEWYIHRHMQEGGRQFHSYSHDRELTVMGLFGTFVVEPKGSEYLDPLGTGDPAPVKSGWQAIIKNGSGPDFREFVLFYHEIGDEAFRPLNKKGDFHAAARSVDRCLSSGGARVELSQRAVRHR